jgi:hypothetical protein
MRRRWTQLWPLAPLLVATVMSASPLGCGNKSSTNQARYLDRESLLDPQTCATCHIGHYKDWAGSMHAYASDDPVFLAMNARGQAETDGGLGSFCVKCHAPMALAEGATTDGTNLATVPGKLKGVTCFFCHSVDSVTGTHNAALTLSDDLVMRGEYTDPVANQAHAAKYSSLHDRDASDSAGLCGSCHDIVSPLGAHIERTYQEWQAYVFANPANGPVLTCPQCHMHAVDNMLIAQNVSGVSPRTYHTHDFPAVDTALTPGFPGEADAGPTVVSELQKTLAAALCVTQLGGVRVILENVTAGHFWPSGAGQDRRVWAEVVASAGGKAFWSSGVVPDGTPVVSLQNDPGPLWLLRDCMFDANSKQVDMFWQAAEARGNELPVQTTLNPQDPAYYATHIVQRFPHVTPSDVLPQMPDQVTLRIRIQPVGLDVLNDLADAGYLDPSVASAMPTWDALPLLTWTPQAAAAQNAGYTEDNNLTKVTCVLSPLAPRTLASPYNNAVNPNQGCSP